MTRAARIPGSLLAVLFIFACPLLARPAAAANGEWVTLGVPMRLRSPLLWDSAERRLIGIGKGSWTDADSLRDVWEFRPWKEWRRISLPKPPATPSIDLDGLYADPAHRRWLAFPVANATRDSVQVWALEFSPSPHWRALEPGPGAPAGTYWLDPRGETVWNLHRLAGGPELELWTRSLADTGQWRLARALSDPYVWEVRRWVEPLQGRMFVLGQIPQQDTSVVLSLPLSGDADWTREPGVAPAEVTHAWPEHLVGDVLGAWEQIYASDYDRPSQVWRYIYGDSTTWHAVGTLPVALPWAVVGDAPESLWVQGANGARFQPGASTLVAPLGDPANVAFHSPVHWPPFVLPGFFVRDRARDRWLYGALGTSVTAARMPADSVWELLRFGESVTWRPQRILGTPPPVGDYVLVANDEEGRTLYRLSGFQGNGWPPSPGAELWALRYDGELRWEKVDFGRLPIYLSEKTVMGFDPVRRELVLVTPGQDGKQTVSTLPVDRAGEWLPRATEGVAPAGGDATTAAFDERRGRLLFRAYDQPAAALEFGDPARWIPSSLSSCVGFSYDCVPSLAGSRGLFDPVGERWLLFGGSDPWFGGAYSDLESITSGDTLGPVTHLTALGDPGAQQWALAGYDATRDAIVVFGNVSNMAPSLSEFRFDRGSRPVARFKAAAALPDRNVLRWAATPGAEFTLWRSSGEAGWSSFADVRTDANGVVSFEDRAINAGTRYGYRLTAPGNAAAPAAEDVWVTASSASSVALAAPWPNPASGALNLSFMTIAGTPADLELYDVVGRRVWSRRWEAPASGPHHVAITSGDLPRSGLYFLRFRQAGVTATRRVVIAR